MPNRSHGTIIRMAGNGMGIVPPRERPAGIRISYVILVR